MGKLLGETKPLVEHQVAVPPSRTRALRAATRTLPHGAYEPRKRILALGRNMRAQLQSIGSDPSRSVENCPGVDVLMVSAGGLKTCLQTFSRICPE